MLLGALSRLRQRRTAAPARAALLLLVFPLLLASCVHPGEKEPNGYAAASPSPPGPEITPGGAGGRPTPEEERPQGTRLFLADRETLWELSPDGASRRALAALPADLRSGESRIVSGPMAGRGGEELFLVIKDPAGSPLVLYFNIPERRWEARPLAGATDWPGWCDGFLPSPVAPVVAWWRTTLEETGVFAELLLTDLEKMESRLLARFTEEMLLPQGWSPDGRALYCQTSYPFAGPVGGTYFYRYQWEEGPPEHFGHLGDALGEPCLGEISVPTGLPGEASAEWHLVGINPYLPGEIWVNEVRGDPWSGEAGCLVRLMRLHGGQGSYRELSLELGAGYLWRAVWHPSEMRFLAWISEESSPAAERRLYLMDPVSREALLLADSPAGAGWWPYPAPPGTRKMEHVR